MSQPEDQQNQSQQSQSSQSSQSSQQSAGDLSNELRELGQQLEQAVRSALESDRAKQVQADVAAGMRELGAQLKNAMTAIQDNPRVQQFVQKGEQAVGQAQQSKAAHDLQDSLARGIAMLNEQLAGFVTRLRQDDGTTPFSSGTGAATGMGATDTSVAPDTSAADMGGSDAGAATGETTRLDPDQK